MRLDYSFQPGIPSLHRNKVQVGASRIVAKPVTIRRQSIARDTWSKSSAITRWSKKALKV